MSAESYIYPGPTSHVYISKKMWQYILCIEIFAAVYSQGLDVVPSPHKLN